MSARDVLASPGWIIGCGAIAVLSVWHARSRPANGRTLRLAAGAVVVVALMVLGLRPERAVRGLQEARIDTTTERGRTHATVEAVARTLAPGARVTIHGDGLDAESVALLAGRDIQWDPPRVAVGLTALRWPRRAVLGETVVISGRHDTGANELVTLDHPEGRTDSTRTRGEFRFSAVPRSAGRWTWIVSLRGRSDTIGIQVREAPGAQVIMVEGRPNREGASVARLLAAQGGGVLQRTRLTANDERVLRYGMAPDRRLLTPSLLETTDVVILAPGALPMLTAAERDALHTAVRSGLGVVHMIDSALATSPVQPFRVQQRQGDERVRVVIDSSTIARTPIPLASVSISGGVPLLRTAAGVPVAWVQREGRGAMVATRLTAPSRWSLAGEPNIESAWWAALLGAAMRQSPAEWRIADTATPRVDHPLVVERVGLGRDTVQLLEPGQDPVAIAMVRAADTLRRRVVLWPSARGWLSLVDGSDTMSVLVGNSGEFATLDRAARRAATRAAVDGPRTPMPVPPQLRERIPLWWAWTSLLAALLVLWKKR